MEDKNYDGIVNANYLGSYFETTATILWEQKKRHKHYLVTLEETIEGAREDLEKLEKINKEKHNRREVPWKKK